MKKKFWLLGLSCLLSLAFSVVAWAYNPGQRTYNLVGNVLNSSKQPLHVEIEQRVDMAKVLKPEAYSLLAENKKVVITNYVYNEVNADYYGQQVLVKDGGGNIVKKLNFIVRDGYLYAIDDLHKTYDRLPNIPGLSKNFTQGLVQWFNEKPEAGVDETDGLDYDQFTLGERSLRMYFKAGTEQWLGYQIGNLPQQRVLSYNQQVEEAALALPPADYQQVANAGLRAQANKLSKK